MLVLTSRTPTPPPRRGAGAALLVSLLALAGCGPDPGTFAPPCPQAAILSDAADVVRYRGNGGHDVTDMVLDGRITGVAGKCAAGEHDTTSVAMSISLDLTRGPAANGRTADVTYFVAVARGQTILDKQNYPLKAEFPSNIDIIHVTTPDVVMNLPTTKDVSGAAYSVLAGFQLTPEELAANRSRTK